MDKFASVLSSVAGRFALLLVAGTTMAALAAEPTLVSVIGISVLGFSSSIIAYTLLVDLGN